MNQDPSYRLTFGFPKGWVQLPVLNSNKVLERDKALEAWAADQARAMLGRDSDKDRVRQRAAELTRLTVGSRGRHAMYGLATMSWTALQIGDKLAEMADAIARTIRIT